MVMADFSRALTKHITMDWMAVSSYGAGTQSSGVAQILKDLDTDITRQARADRRGHHRLRASRSRWLLENLRARGAASVEVFACCASPRRAKVEVHCKYVGFDIPTEFVVGYGLDYAEHYRNLRDVARPRTSTSTRDLGGGRGGGGGGGEPGGTPERGPVLDLGLTPGANAQSTPRKRAIP